MKSSQNSVHKQRTPEFRVYVEGGGNDNAALKDQCRRGFSALIGKLNLKRNPRIVACGSRGEAYDDFCNALDDAQPGDALILLVDAEAPVSNESPWQHLRHRPGDGWNQPEHATDDHCHLMTQCMETWLLVDRAPLKSFFGQGFQESALPNRANLEEESKVDMFAKLKKATVESKSKGEYGKGAHSFKLLALVDPAKVRQLPWADRFFTYLLAVA